MLATSTIADPLDYIISPFPLQDDRRYEDEKLTLHKTEINELNSITNYLNLLVIFSKRIEEEKTNLTYTIQNSYFEDLTSSNSLREVYGKLLNLVLNTYHFTEDTQEIFYNLRLIMLERIFTVDDPQLVYSFLKDNPKLINLLFDSLNYLKKYFGDDASYSLVIESDPESSDPEKTMFVYIKTSLEIDKALENLDKFDTVWFLDQFSKAGGLINFNLE